MLQAWEVVLAIRETCWGPIVHLLSLHERLSSDARWICQLVSEGTSLVTGFGGAAPQSLPSTSSRCDDSESLSR